MNQKLPKFLLGLCNVLHFKNQEGFSSILWLLCTIGQLVSHKWAQRYHNQAHLNHGMARQGIGWLLKWVPRKLFCSSKVEHRNSVFLDLTMAIEPIGYWLLAIGYWAFLHVHRSAARLCVLCCIRIKYHHVWPWRAKRCQSNIFITHWRVEMSTSALNKWSQQITVFQSVETIHWLLQERGGYCNK